MKKPKLSIYTIIWVIFILILMMIVREPSEDISRLTLEQQRSVIERIPLEERR